MSTSNGTVARVKGLSTLSRPNFGPGMLLQHGDLAQLTTYTARPQSTDVSVLVRVRRGVRAGRGSSAPPNAERFRSLSEQGSRSIATAIRFMCPRIRRSSWTRNAMRA